MDDLERLRGLLLDEERQALDAARRRIDALERAGAALPDDLPRLLEAAPRDRLRGALAEPVALALGEAVRRDRRTLVEVLFPVIGPAIRKAISEALAALVADLNGALERSLSLRGLAWRLEALRSGVPYAQVVLKHTLRYRIDHLFLIERESGLVMHRESAPELQELDGDAIGAMLTAIADFVRDSVGREDGQSLDTARIGEHLLWLVEGPRWNLACFISGVPPEALRTILRERLEQIHREADTQPDASPDPTAQAAHWQTVLDPVRMRRDAMPTEDVVERVRSMWPLLVVALLGLAGLLAYFVHRERWQHEVAALGERLARHPGFVPTAIESPSGRTLRVEGLFDPDADPIDAELSSPALQGVRIIRALRPYVSADDGVLARRARRLLAAPATVEVVARDAVLHLTGVAGESWIARARDRAAWVPGARAVEFAVASATDPAAIARARLDEIATAAARLTVGFSRDTEAVDGADAVVAALADLLRPVPGLAAQAGVAVAIELHGVNDAPGSEQVNARVRGQRADWLAHALAERGIDTTLLRPVRSDERGDDEGLRRAAFARLRVEPATAPLPRD